MSSNINLLGSTSLFQLPLALVSVSLLLYTIYGAIYRLYLSPIAHIPGPRFAALSFWNEFYYDVILIGRYTWKIGEYHEKYGRHSSCRRSLEHELRDQGRSFASTRMKSISMTQNTTRSCTLVAAKEKAINGTGLYVILIRSCFQKTSYTAVAKFQGPRICRGEQILIRHDRSRPTPHAARGLESLFL